MSAIIFDFDGTIAGTFDYVADFLAAEAGIAHLSDTQRQELHSMSMIEMARHLGHHSWRLPGLFYKGRKAMNHSIGHIAPFNGMVAVIEELHAENHELYIVTSNNVHNVHMFLHNHQLQSYFLDIYSGASVFGKSVALRRLLKAHHLERQNSIYVGDELRDVKAARSVKLRVVAVTWGFARLRDLQAASPTALVNTPTELLKQLARF